MYNKYVDKHPSISCDPLLKHAMLINSKLIKRKELLLNSVELRARRGIMKTLAQTAQVLYGLCDWDCIKRFESSIGKLKETKADQMNVPNENMRVVNIKHEVNEAHIAKLEETVFSLVNVSESMYPRIESNRQFTAFNQVMLIQMFRINTLVEIIQSARTGQIHPSLINTKALLEQFRNIKLTLPSGTNMPLEVELINVYELVKISDLTVYFNNDNIVFILNIPLVYTHELSLYNLIPLPVCSTGDKKKSMFIKPAMC